MFTLMLLAAGADPSFVVIDRTTRPAFVVVDRTTPRPPKPATLPTVDGPAVPIPPGYGRVVDGPDAGRLIPLYTPTPALSPGCYIDPRTGRQVCPYTR